MSQRQWSVPITIFRASMFGLAALAGCSPLPGSSLDPVYVKIGTKAASESTQPASPREAASRPAQPAPRTVVKAIGASVWVGRYRDSRGEGDMTFSLMRGESLVSGTWKLRTGGGGPLTGVAEAKGQRLQLRMENTAPECPGTFEGWAEVRGSTLVGAYHGKDCDGPVSEGSFELRHR